MENDPSVERIALRGQMNWPREAPAFTSLGAACVAVEDAALLQPLQSMGTGDLGAWVDRIARAEIVVNRRNSPDLSGQLAQALRRPIDTVLCSVLDVDPSACVNSAVAAQFPLEVAAGILLMGKITNARRVACVTDATVPSAWLTKLRKACSGIGARYESIINEYPQAEPTLLLYSMLGRRLRPGRLPSELGVLLFDAPAAAALGRCALSNAPMTQVPIVVCDRVVGQSHYVLAETGIALRALFEKLGLPVANRTIRGGDFLRDEEVNPDTSLGTGELVLYSAWPEAAVNPSPCTRCGWCADACPTRVYPAGVLEAAQHEDMDLAARSGVESCIECGICSYVCPSKLPLLAGLRSMKGKS